MEWVSKMIAIILQIFLLFCGARATSISVSIQPNDATAGEAFETQPQVAIYDDDGDLYTSFSGYVYAEISTGPTGFESLYYEGSTEATDNAAYFSEGKAQFEGLYINDMGDGYTLSFTAAKSSGSLVAFAYSDEFSVAQGDAYQVGFYITPGNADGGSAFSPQPIISVQDKGGNTLTDVSEGYVTVALAANPNNGTLRPTTMLTQPFQNGYATFASLYIDEAGSGYVLGFNATLALAGDTYLESNEFDVGVGDPATLKILQEAADLGSVTAGENFPTQPKVQVLDAGGNVVATDSENALLASVSQNPSGGTLGPSWATEVVLLEGVAHFGDLYLDLEGVAYIIRYTFMELDSTGLDWDETSIYADGEEFNVEAGDPRSLVFEQEADDAWAGGQPFSTQPYLRLEDMGGNLVADDSTVVEVFMVPSLVTSRTVAIDTSGSAAPAVARVYASTAAGAYGQGHEVLLVVEFDQEVTLTAQAATLALNVLNGTDPGGGGHRLAECVSRGNRSTTQTFLYLVGAGEAVDVLETNGTAALAALGGGNFTSNIGLAANLTLPAPYSAASVSQALAHNVSVDTRRPNVTAVYTPHAEGDFGVGEEILVVLNYSFPVSVTGAPRLPLNLGPNGTAEGVYAEYHAGSGTRYLAFLYTVGAGENVSALGLHPNGTVALPDGAAVLQYSTNPSLPAVAEISPRLGLAKTLSVDTDVVTVDAAYGVWASVDGAVTYTAGDYFSIYVRFTKPVYVSGGDYLSLKLETGDDHDYTAEYASGSGTHTLRFDYTVQLLDEAADLDTYSDAALQFSGSGHALYRDSTNPSQKVDRSLRPAWLNATNLANNSDVTLDGTYPYVLGVYMDDRTPDLNTYFYQDTVYIRVNLSAAVVVIGDPVLKLDLVTVRDATYYSGNLTDSLVFAYTLQLGDKTPNLAYRYSPNAFCLTTNCPGTATGAYSIKRLSMYPELALDKTLETEGGTSSLGVPIGNATKVNTSNEDVTTRIVSVSMLEPTEPGVYGVGQELYVQVEFSDEVSMSWGASAPELYLNTGELMVYTDGDTTKYFTFLALVKAGDNISELDWAPFGNYSWGSLNYTDPRALNQSYTALVCPDPYCGLENNLGTPVDLNMTGIASMNSGIKIDTTPPVVVEVYTDKQTSPYDGTYTVGEEIYVHVVFDKTIKVLGEPTLELETGDSDTIAEYVSYSDYTITFLYTVAEGDSAGNLTYSGPNAIDLDEGGASVLKYSDAPETAANLTLPTPPPPLARNGSTVTVATDDTPAVVAVRSLSPNGTYAPGDNVTLQLEFSEVLEVSGTPLLYLELGTQDRYAKYVGGSGTKFATFNFTVISGDLTYDLDYASARSLYVGVDEIGNDGTMLQMSTTPTTALDLELPEPGSNTSLSGTSDIVIDGRQPYIVNINISEPDGTYVFEDTIDLLVEFSQTVAVSGVPCLLLDTGKHLREACYLTGDGTTLLRFRYTVMVGDSSEALDYYAPESEDFSAVTSFRLHGGSVRRWSSNPTLAADVHLNPVNALLWGTTEVTAEAGYVYFSDLKILERGPDFKLRFRATPAATGKQIDTSQYIRVIYSAEFEVMADDQKSGDYFGYSTDMTDGTVVVGAPFKPSPTTEVQVVRTSASSSAFQREVQWVVLEAGSQLEIQKFVTYSDPYTTTSGYFKLGYGSYGPTSAIPADASTDQVKTAIEEDLPSLLTVTVSRNTYDFCACTNGYEWTVTFNDLVGSVDPLDVYGSLLEGDGAAASAVQTLQNSPVLNGTLTLGTADGSAVGANGTTATRDIPFDVDATTLADILSTDLGLDTRNITTTTASDGLQIIWKIEFEPQNGNNYDVPDLIVEEDNLVGGGFVWALTLQEGLSPLNGTFRLNWNGAANWTRDLAWDAPADEMEAALEDLESINNVTVTRSRMEPGGGFEWTITFESFNEEDEYGWSEADHGNLPAIEVDSNLVGADNLLEVSYFYGGAMDYPPWEAKRMGMYGYNGGAAYVLTKDGKRWVQSAKLTGDEVDSGDRFGHAVAISRAGDRVLVGAPYDEEYGENERQALHCRAANGTFRLGFRGFATAPISWNATYWELEEAMEGDFGTTKNLHSLPRVKMHLSEWFGAEQGTGFCDNNTVVFEFVVPQDGDLDELTLYKSALNGTLTVEERVKGTNNPTAPGAYGAQKGAVYFFEYDDDDGWVQTDKGTTSSEVGTERFGYSVSIYDDWAIVGAPGEDNEDGKVFVYYPNGDGTWQFYQELEAIDSDSWFGHSVDIYGDYLVIGAPKYNNSQGSAHIYYMDGGSNTFVLEDGNSIYPASVEGNGTALSTEACLGWSVAVDSDTVVVSAPGNAARQIYLGTEVPDENVQSAGSVFVYEWGADGWGFKQSLLGTNIKLRDRFGHAVATYGDETILVASLEDYIGDLETYKPVQVITTTASGCADDPDGCEKVGSTFRLGWQTTWTSNDEGGAASTVWTSLMESDVTAAELKAALEDELGTGEVTVKRTGPSLTTGGYAWSVTFYDFAPELQVALFQADGATLTGSGAGVAVAEAVDVGFFIRSLVHLYRKVDGEWTETAFIAPALLQRQDLFGSSLAIHDQHAMVGAPNRDIFASGLNSGAVLAFKLDFMHLYFDQSNYTVTEGSGLWIDLLRDTCPQLNNIGVEVRTLDRNADADLEDYVEELFDLYYVTPNFKTATDMVGAGEAYGRAQYYGSAENRSEWVGGQYDYRGISDYNPLDETVVFQRHSDVLTVGLNTTGDAISEQPDEAVRLTLKLPGAYPSLLGRMTALVTIEDDLDGYLDEENRMGFTKLEFSDPEEDQQFGRAAAIDDAAGILVVGAPNKHRFGREGVGRVYVFQRVLLGTWEETASLYGSQINDTAKAYFGQSVAIDTPYGRNDTTAAAAAPGTAQVYIFVVANCSATCLWEEQSVLTADGVSARDGFGASGALALDHDTLVVGSAQLETIYVYERYYDAGAGGWVWAAAASRRSSDYDYDAITVTNVTHRQDFGRAVGLSGRTLVAGAPYADYNNLGAVGDVSDYDSYGAENLNRGRAYVFYSRPHVQRVTLAAVQEPSEGTFRLRLADRGLNATTAQLGFSASAASMKAALEELANVDEVEVAFASDVDAYAVYRWTVSFVSATVDPPLLVPLYNGSGCADCTPINQAWLTPEQVNVSVVQTIEPWVEQTQLKADDRRSGDLFGYSVAVDGDYVAVRYLSDRALFVVANSATSSHSINIPTRGKEKKHSSMDIVGSPLSSALTCTTWDFETGDLVGWTATGDAFDDQPTFGDNTRHRSVYEGVSDFRSHGAPQVSRHKGRYWVGTYESRPGAGAANYTSPAEGYPAGTAQGDEPTGTLTSQPFLILGDAITFLVGGGCDHLTEYVELLVDGFAAARATGKCRETMEPHTWDVALYYGRAAQIRIVDASSTRWAHINVDHFRFSWDTRGGKHYSYGQNSSSSGDGAVGEAGSVLHYCHAEETPHAGAAYAFRRQANGSLESCTGDKFLCEWSQMRRLTASDKRGDDHFGHSVAYDDELGLAAVGAYQSTARGIWREPLSSYPHGDPTLVALPLSDYFEGRLQAAGPLSPLPSGARAVWAQAELDGVTDQDETEQEQAGAVYIFKLYPEETGSGGALVSAPYWLPTETVKIAPHDGFARDYFGYTVRLDGRSLLVGAINHDLMAENAGIAYEFDVAVARIYFSEAEYVLLENYDEVDVTLYRDAEYTDLALTVQYATSDLTATGVDTAKFDACQKLAVRYRPGDCGDYEQTRGEVTFAAGSASAAFSVRIMDDFCYEHFMEYFQVTLSIPGTNFLAGEEFYATVRIDDNDFDEDYC